MTNKCVDNKASKAIQFHRGLHQILCLVAGDHLSLPQELIEAAAGLSVQREDVVKKLVDAMGAIAAVAADVDSNLKQIREFLEVRNPRNKKLNYTFQALR